MRNWDDTDEWEEGKDWEEEDWREIEEENEELLEEFRDWLREKGLREGSIDDHLYNISLFVTDYLAGFEMTRSYDATAEDIEDFVGEWCIRKVDEVSPTWIQHMLTSLSRFYKFLSEREEISDLERILAECKKKQKYMRRAREYTGDNEESGNWESDSDIWPSGYEDDLY